jgi:hypothetical protein
VTLHVGHLPYMHMNQMIKTAAERHGSLTVVDWNLYSQAHEEWFQDDGVHLLRDGADAMATLLRNALARLNVPRVVPPEILTTKLPWAKVGRTYAARLVARGGHGPYRWTSMARLPMHIRLTPDGLLGGVVRARPGTVDVSFRVSDTEGASSTRRFILRVRR